PRAPVRAASGQRGVPRGLRAGRVVHRVVRGELELAGSDLVPGQLPPDRVAPEVPLLLRGRAQGGVSVPLGETDDAVGRRRRALPAAHPSLPARARRAAAGLRRDGDLPGGSPLARPHPLLRVLPGGQRRRDRCQPPDGLDRAGGEAPPADRGVAGPGPLRPPSRRPPSRAQEAGMIFELRQYHVHPGQRDKWVRFMEEEIIPFQVKMGMVILGSFVGEEDESTYVWIRRFDSEQERKRLYDLVYQSDYC